MRKDMFVKKIIDIEDSTTALAYTVIGNDMYSNKTNHRYVISGDQIYILEENDEKILNYEVIDNYIFEVGSQTACFEVRENKVYDKNRNIKYVIYTDLEQVPVEKLKKYETCNHNMNKWINRLTNLTLQVLSLLAWIGSIKSISSFRMVYVSILILVSLVKYHNLDNDLEAFLKSIGFIWIFFNLIECVISLYDRIFIGLNLFFLFPFIAGSLLILPFSITKFFLKRYNR